MRANAFVLGAALIALSLAAPTTARAAAVAGRAAPWFRLQSVTGKTVTREQLKGQPTVIVVGRTEAVAQQCKAWTLGLLRRHGGRVKVYQVIVTDNPWFVPRGLVRGKIRDFVPRAHWDKVLVEWHTVFADAWGVPEKDRPVVFVVDAAGVVRWRHAGPANAAAQRRLDDVLAPYLARR